MSFDINPWREARTLVYIAFGYVLGTDVINGFIAAIIGAIIQVSLREGERRWSE